MVVVVSFLPWRSFFNSNTSSKVDLTGTPHIEEHTRPLWNLHQELDNITPQRAILHHEGGVWCEVASPLYLGLQFSVSRYQFWDSLMACTPCQPTMSIELCMVAAVSFLMPWRFFFKANTSSKVNFTGTPQIEDHTRASWYLHPELDTITPERVIIYHEGGVWFEVASPLYLGLQLSLSHFQSWESLLACTPCQPINEL